MSYFTILLSKNYSLLLLRWFHTSDYSILRMLLLDCHSGTIVQAPQKYGKVPHFLERYFTVGSFIFEVLYGFTLLLALFPVCYMISLVL